MPTRADRILEKLKNHPAISVGVVCAIAVIGLGAFTESIDKIWSFAERRFSSENQAIEQDNAAPKGTGSKARPGTLPESPRSSAQERTVESDASATSPPAPSPAQKAHDELKANIDARYRESRLLSYSTHRDNALKQIITYGLAQNGEEIVEPYVANLSYSTDRDNAYKQVIASAVKNGKYDLATEIVEKLGYSEDRDQARRMILEARLAK